MDVSQLGDQAFLWQLANDVVLPIVGVAFPLLLLGRAARADRFPWLSAEALAYVVYAACAAAYGREVLVAGGWASVAFGAFLLARGAYRGRLGAGATTCRRRGPRR